MNQRSRILRAGSVVPCVLALATACQATTQTGTVDSPAPTSVSAPQPQTHAMGHDTARAHAAMPARADTAAHQMDPDTRFMHHMIAHHAQALRMVEMVPSRGASQGLRLLAERIDISQKDETAMMRRWLQQRGKPLPDEGEHAAHMAGMAMPGMLTPAELARLESTSGSEFERLFLEFMIRHHEGALTMVAQLLGSQGAAQDSELFRLASDIDADQRAEIDRMRRMLNAIGGRPPG